MKHAKGDILELSLHGFSSDGRTVGRTDDGLTVFVRGGVPGQRVRARLTAVKNEGEGAAMFIPSDPIELFKQ